MIKHDEIGFAFSMFMMALLAGCGAASPDAVPLSEAGADADTFGEAQASGGEEKASDYFEKTTSNGEKYIAYQGHYMCVLSLVTGNFNGDDEINNSGQAIVDWKEEEYYKFFWRDGWTNARALCTNWSNFLVGAGGVKQYSAGAWAEVFGYEDQTAEVEGWTGDAITFVRGVNGEMQGGGEYAQILQSTTVGGKSKLRVHEESGSAFDWTFLTGFSQSFRIGKPGSRLIRLMGYDTNGNSTRGTVNSSGTFDFAVSSVSGYSGYWMTPVDDGFCGFTHISGNFDGGGEVIRIYKTDGWWFLKASTTGGKPVYANSRCVAYDQR